MDLHGYAHPMFASYAPHTICHARETRMAHPKVATGTYLLETSPSNIECMNLAMHSQRYPVHAYIEADTKLFIYSTRARRTRIT